MEKKLKKQKEFSEPLVEEILELYARTPEGLPLWKTKDLIITCENLLDNIFVLSSDIASYFNIRHDNLCSKNIGKLQERNYLPDQLLNFKELIAVGKTAKKPRMIYALTRQQTEHLIMDFSGPRAFQKKHDILDRLHAIEADVLKGAYAQAREKAQNFEGVELLKDLGFNCSVEDNLATKKDIACFLKLPESTVNTFLRKHKEQIKPVTLDRKTIRNTGSQANRMNAYRMDDVLKIAFWMQSEVGVELKHRLLGKTSVLVKSESRKEIEWRTVLSRIFEGFDLVYNFSIGRYRVDFFVKKLLLALEHDNNHESYNPAEEEERERVITRYYTLIRFNDKTTLEDLFNAILKAQIKEVINLYA